VKHVEGTSLTGVYDCYLATEDNLSDLEYATIEDWLKMMLKQIKERRRDARDRSTEVRNANVPVNSGSGSDGGNP